MGLASFNRMRREQAALLNSTAPVIAEKVAKPKADKPADVAAPELVGATDALALSNGHFMTFRAAAKKVLGDALPAKKPEIVAALEALAGGGEPVSETPDGIPTPIPDAWEAMTDDELLALAAELSGGPVVETDNGTPVERAKSIIQATVDDRASRANV
ncbi:hypothetical protein O9Z70_06395 [Devosia sp. YIM 151766]|uniref:hypothetical protein n=1 Tax=Devosia sp. YIM 151766 TaxID=3017325 RepID=UPI00255C5DE4|nr:hypothetical protein [Devosia sp. YIM 151766]WIY54147.1 hypothetical protein O9Z70_06395 [Devosia sp. YIM 151766]